MKQSEIISAKILDEAGLKTKLAYWDLKAKKVVFTNGCFDILHKGHIATLTAAKDMGDVLVVGLNADKSVKRLKGEKRPINQEQDRASLLAALSLVDAVILFTEDTPEKLIKTIRPDVLVKGGDWEVDQIVGGEFVQSYGGEVHSVPYIEGHSTTAIIEHLD